MPAPKENPAVTRTDSEKHDLKVSHEDIAIRAYYLYLDGGAANGHDLSDWLQAESQLRDENSVVKPSTRAKSA
jgi:hypothetical protein